MSGRIILFIFGCVSMLSGCAARSHDQDVSVSVDAAEAYQSSVRRYDELSQLHREGREAEKKAAVAELSSQIEASRAEPKPVVEAALGVKKEAEAQLYAQEQRVINNAELEVEQGRLRELEKKAFGTEN
jgi:transposase